MATRAEEFGVGLVYEDCSFHPVFCTSYSAVVGQFGSGAGPRLITVTTKVGPGASGAIRMFAGWVARGSVGYPMLEGINYWDELRDSPSQMETCFAIFANVLELDDAGRPTNAKYAERRAATWLYRYCTGRQPAGEPELASWEVELY